MSWWSIAAYHNRVSGTETMSDLSAEDSSAAELERQACERTVLRVLSSTRVFGYKQRGVARIAG